MAAELWQNSTIAYYNENAANFHSTGQTFWIHEIDDFKEYLESGKVIEIGCASGVEAKILSERYEYLGVDLSERMVEVARESVPNARFECLDLFELNSLHEKFDGFWCVATLLHVSKDQMDAALKSISNVMNDKSVGFISVKEGEGEFVDESGRFFSLWQKKEFSKCLRKAGFEVIDHINRGRSSRSDDTTEVRWLGFFVEKTG